MNGLQNASMQGADGPLVTVLQPEAIARLLGHTLDPAQVAALHTYTTLLLEATGRLNLTSVRDRVGIERRHVLESLALLGLLEHLGLVPEGGTVIDVGSGGGLPGIPIAIARPDLHITLLEATRKKVAFLDAVIRSLGLARAATLAARAEAAGHDPQHRERYDLALARAVAPLDVLVELTLPLLRVGGHLAAVKGSRVAEEIAAATVAMTRCGGRVERVEPLPAADEDYLSVVLAIKERPTPPDLPRRPGMPAKRPLR